MSERRLLTPSDYAVALSNLREIEAEARALRESIRASSNVDITPGAFPWNVVSTIAGDLANVSSIIFGLDGPIE